MIHANTDRKVIAIAAADREWGIGKGGKLLCHLPGDLKYFQAKTMGHIIVMGRKTFESLPGGKALPGRTNVVLTRQAGYSAEDALVVRSLSEFVELLDETKVVGGDVYICGGGSIYEEFLPFTDTCLITRIDHVFGADTFFPDLDADASFHLKPDAPKYSENGITYRFCEYFSLKENS